MMRPSHCKSCKARLPDKPDSKVTREMLPGPWPTFYDVSKFTCVRCRHRSVSVLTGFRHLDSFVHSADDERLSVGDIRLLHERKGYLPGKKPRIVIWAWTPVKMDMPLQAEWLLEAVDTILVYPDGHTPESLGVLTKLVTQIVELRPHVMAGAEGPYPSYKAESAILATWGQNLQKVVHFWPSVRFDRSGYFPLAPDSELVRLWAEHARENTWFEV